MPKQLMLLKTKDCINYYYQSRNKLESAHPNYAYEILLLEIIVEDDQYFRKPTID